MISDKKIITVSVGDLRGLILFYLIIGNCINTVFDPFIPDGNISGTYYLLVLMTIVMVWWLIALYREAIGN